MTICFAGSGRINFGMAQNGSFSSEPSKLADLNSLFVDIISISTDNDIPVRDATLMG